MKSRCGRPRLSSSAASRISSAAVTAFKIGLHRGAAIAVTLNDRLDYFGQTVNIASRVQNLAGGDEICLTEEVRHAPGVDDVLAPYAIRTAEARLKGIEQATPVYIVGDKLPSDVPA